MAKITYLLGAGASANTIPVVSQMTERIDEVIEHLKKYQGITNSPNLHKWLLPNNRKLQGQQIVEKYEKSLQNIISDLQFLNTEAANHFTIDTLAKKYYLKGGYEQLKRLKTALVTYFTLEQFVFFNSNRNKVTGYDFSKQEFDKRYDSFIASITQRVDERLILNSDIKILSWNYDSQMEICLEKYFERGNINKLKVDNQIFPNISSYEGLEEVNIDNSKFALVKLNGTALWELIPDGSYTPDTIFDLDVNKQANKMFPADTIFLKNLGIFLDYFIDAYFSPGRIKVDPRSIFNFAWEHDPNFIAKYSGHSRNLEYAIDIASKTEVLVVIGYSFPIFNREIDNRIFSKMSNLKKVYVQDKDPVKIQSTMINAFKVLQQEMYLTSSGSKVPIGSGASVVLPRVKKVDFQLEASTNNFLIPYELS